MAEPRRLDRLTAQDLMMLWPDELGWSQDIAALAILDGTRLLDRDGRVRIQAIRRQLEPRLHLVPRFRQLLYRPRQGLGWPLWVDAASFDLADHIRVHPLATPGDEAQLLQAYAQLSRRRLDPPADAPTPVAPPWTPAPLPTAGELLRDNLRRRLLGLGRGLSGLAHPSRTGRGAPGRRGGRPSPSVPPHQPQPSDRCRPPAGGRPQPPGGYQAGRPRTPRHGQRRGPGRRRRRPAPAAGRPWRGRPGAGAARDGAHLAPSRAAWAGTRQPGRRDDGAAAAGRARPCSPARPDRRGDGRAQTAGPPAAGQRDLPVRRRPARVVSDPGPPAVREPHRHQRPGPAGAAVSCRSAAAGTVPRRVAHGQRDPRCRRVLLCRAAQPHRGRRPGHLPRPRGVRRGRAQRLDGLARSMLVAASRGGVWSIADTLADNSYTRRGALESAATAISEPESSTRAACLRPIR